MFSNRKLSVNEGNSDQKMSRTFLNASTPGDEGNERIRLCIPSPDAQLSVTYLEPSLQQQSQVLQQEPISICC